MKPEKRIYTFSEFAADEDLAWTLFKNGDMEAYGYLYAAYSALLFRYGCKVLPDREQVKDCMHDLFTELWKNKSNLGTPASVKNYLVKSLRNKLLRQAMKQEKFVGEEELLSISNFHYSESHELDLIRSETRSNTEKRLIAALKKLTNKQKEIIFLLYYNNLSPAEAAVIMSVSVRTIYNTTFTAIQSLKSELSVPVVYFLICYYSL